MIIELRKVLANLSVAAVIVAFFLFGQYVFTSQFPLVYETMTTGDQPAFPLYRIEASDKFVVLTFDVNWGNEVPESVAAALSDMGVQASFFVSAPWATSHSSTVEEMLKAGHDVASLGNTTVDYRKLRPLEVRNDMVIALHGLEQFEGSETSVLRPPLGEYDAEVLAVARSLDLRLVLWDVESLDWKLTDPQDIVERVVSAARPGSIVRFHADDSYSHVIDLLPLLVNRLNEAGFTIRPLRAVVDLTH